MDKPSQFRTHFRWLVKKAFKGLPQKKYRRIKKISNIGFYFSGTYGDLFQSLDSWKLLRKIYPEAKLYLKMPQLYYSQIESRLPEVCCLMNWKSILSGFDLFFTNVVGVYKNEALILGYFFSRNFYGFCYAEERGRKAQTLSLRLPSRYNNNALIQRELILLSETNTGKTWADLSSEKPADPHSSDKINVNSSEVLFHIGAAGLKSNMGVEKFFLKNLEAVELLENKFKKKIEIIAGPGDADVIHFLRRKKPDLKINQFNLEDLILRTQNFSGLILCWNSMYAHLCYYLKKPVLVLQHNKIPAGYDNGDLHTQLIIKDSENLDLEPLKLCLGN